MVSFLRPSLSTILFLLSILFSNPANAQDVIFDHHFAHGHVAGIAEVKGDLYLAINQPHKGLQDDVASIQRHNVEDGTNRVVATLEKNEQFDMGLVPYKGGFVTTAWQPPLASFEVITHKPTHTLYGFGIGKSGNPVELFNRLIPNKTLECLLVAPISGDVFFSGISDKGHGFDAVINRKGQQKFTLKRNATNPLINCPVVSQDESSLYFASGGDAEKQHGTITKLSMIDGSVEAVSDEPFDHSVRGPALDNRGSVFIESFQKDEHYIARYNDETMKFRNKITLPNLQSKGDSATISDISNPISTPNGTFLYLFEEDYVIGMQSSEPNDILFKTKIESGSRPPILTRNAAFLVFYAQTGKEIWTLTFLDPVNGDVLKKKEFDDADMNKEPVLQIGEDLVYFAYVLKSDSEHGSRITAFDTPQITTVRESKGPTHRKETWTQFLFEFLLYFLILILSIAYQLWRMFRSGRPAAAGSNGYAAVAAKEDGVEMTELNESALNAEYGDVDEDDEDE